MTVYAATRMYVRRSSLRSCYSQSLLSSVPPCTIADTCEWCLHTATATRQWLHGGRRFRVALNAWAHTRRALTARPIKANYLKIVTIRPLYRDPMPSTYVGPQTLLYMYIHMYIIIIMMYMCMYMYSNVCLCIATLYPIHSYNYCIYVLVKVLYWVQYGNYCVREGVKRHIYTVRGWWQSTVCALSLALSTIMCVSPLYMQHCG